MSNLAWSMTTSPQIKITVNGEPREVPPGLTLLALLDRLGVDVQRVAVELDRAIVRKSAWDETPIGEGATLEIVEFVGGGR